MQKTLTAVGFAVAVGVSMASAPSFAADAAAGEDVFNKKCKTCHALDKAKVGPPLGGIVGSKAGTADFKRYVGLENADFEWTPELLDEYIEDPKTFVETHTENKRTAMTFKLKDEEDRANVIEYLKTTSR